MRKLLPFFFVFAALGLQECRVARELQKTSPTLPEGMEGLSQLCPALDTIQSILISKSEAILLFDKERYEVSVTLFSKKDSIIYLSAVNSGFEILRGSIDEDTIRMIDRLNKIVYRTPLKKRFGYQHPVNFNNLQSLISKYYLCNKLDVASENANNQISFEFDETNIKKRISLDRSSFQMQKFEFYHSKTSEYIMGERTEGGIRIFSNFIISDFEIFGSGGTVSYNKDIKVKMNVNPGRYSFVDLQ
jgi:hypothetical protein